MSKINLKTPRIITVCGHDIKIRHTSKLALDKDPCWGFYDDNSRTIWLRTKMDKSRKAEVLLHEIIHAIAFIHNLNVSEKAVNTLAIEIMAFMKHNKLSVIKKVMK